MPLSETIVDVPPAKGFFRLRVRNVRPETRDAIAVTFDVPSALEEQFAFAAGQHLTLRKEIDGEEIRRTYSICAATQDKILRIAIKRMPDGIFSNWANDRLKIGNYLEVMPPAGQFCVSMYLEQPYNFMAISVGHRVTAVLCHLESDFGGGPP